MNSEVGIEYPHDKRWLTKEIPESIKVNGIAKEYFEYLS